MQVMPIVLIVVGILWSVGNMVYEKLNALPPIVQAAPPKPTPTVDPRTDQILREVSVLQSQFEELLKRDNPLLETVERLEKKAQLFEMQMNNIKQVKFPGEMRVKFDGPLEVKGDLGVHPTKKFQVQHQAVKFPKQKPATLESVKKQIDGLSK